MNLAPLADEVTTLLRAASAARDALAGGALIDLRDLEPRLERLCTALRGQPGAAGLRPLLRALENELGLLSEAMATRLAKLNPPSGGAAPAQGVQDGG